MISTRLRKYAIISISVIVVVALIVLFIYYLTTNLPRGAVVTNGKRCAAIGAEILDDGGTAVDAAIGSLFCEGVSMPQSMGLGGGFLMTIYSQATNEMIVLNARETAPAAATENMFNGNGQLSQRGRLSMGVPGELRGYWRAYQRYGKLPWSRLIQPTIELCEEGVPVTPYLSNLMATRFELLYKDPMLRSTYIDPNTNQTYVTGDYVKYPKLAETLKVIAEEGGDALNNGSLTQKFMEDLDGIGSIISEDDLKNYEPEWQKPLTVNLSGNRTLYTVPPPGSGVLLGFILNILDDFLHTSLPDAISNWQRIIESFKFAYGKRTLLGDTNFVNIEGILNQLLSPDYANQIRGKIYDDRTFQDPAYYGANTTYTTDYGTAHISILAPNGDAVSVTSTINFYWGSGIMLPSTGIIMNDQMDDFSSPNMTSGYDLPPSVANYIEPGKRPLSSMCPSIVLQNGGVRLIVGAAGGTKITSSVALVVIKNLWFNVSITDAVDAKRLHHQLFPMLVEYEDAYKNDMDFIDALHSIGHEYEISPANGFSALTAIEKRDDFIEMTSDRRRPGATSYVY